MRLHSHLVSQDIFKFISRKYRLLIRIWRFHLRSSGLEVAATASQRNFDLLRAVGADHVFDYKSPTCGEDIRKATKDRVAHAFDTIGSQESAAICCAGIGSRGGKYSSIIRVEGLPREDVSNALTLAYTIVGEDIQLGGNGFTGLCVMCEAAKAKSINR